MPPSEVAKFSVPHICCDQYRISVCCLKTPKTMNQQLIDVVVFTQEFISSFATRSFLMPILRAKTPF